MLFRSLHYLLLKLMSIESMIPSNHLILCCTLFLPPSIFPSIRVFSNESILHIRWQKYWSFSFNISLSTEYSGLISFRMNWLDLLAVQGPLKSLLHHHTSKASILWQSAFFIVQLSHPYMTTGKTKALIRRTFVGKVMCLLFNMLSRLVITFLPGSKCLLISWLQSPYAVIFGAPQNKVSHCFYCFPIYLPKQNQHSVVDVTGDGREVQCYKQQYCIGTWNVRSMNQGKLEVVKQEMARVNVDILGISEVKWTGMGKFNPDYYYIYNCGQESLRRNGVAIIVNKRV